jgi:hypothetical protein
MRVEQRIGRVDRIGQVEPVQIFNLWVRGTIEERILDVLERRINVFEETVGGLDPILGETEKDLRQALKLAESERDAALHRLEENLERDVKSARAAEVKLRDFIMDTKSFSKGIAERIAGQDSPISADDQERFITALLADVRTHIKKTGDEWQLTFNDPFTSDFREFFVDGRKRRAVFRADERRDTEFVDYFAFGHPIVDALVDRVLSASYPGVNGTISVEESKDLPAGVGWLFVYVLSLPGVRPISRLVPVYVADADQTTSLTVGEALVRRAAQFPRSGDLAIPLDAIPFDRLEEVQAVAEMFIGEEAALMQLEAERDTQTRIDRERTKLEAYFDYRQRSADDRLANTATTLERLKTADSDGERRVVPIWQANLERDERLVQELSDERTRQLANLEKLRNPIVDQELVSAGRVEIRPAPSGATGGGKSVE